MVMRTAGAWLALMVLLAIPRGAYAQTAPVDTLLQQSQGEADRKSSGCVTCHTSTDSASMHASGTVRLGCIDCHGGNNDVRISQGIAPKSGEYERLKRQAHPQPRVLKGDAANPMRSYTDWLREDWNYVRFVNPGDLRVAEKNLRYERLPHRRSSQSPDQHDDPRGNAVGSGTLQQRSFSF